MALSMIVACVFISIPAVAFFGEQLEVAVTSRLCKVAWALNGTIGRAMGAAAIMLLAFLAFWGKASWAAVAVTVTGIAMVFGASALVDMIGEQTFMGIGGVFQACALSVATDAWYEYDGIGDIIGELVN